MDDSLKKRCHTAARLKLRILISSIASITLSITFLTPSTGTASQIWSNSPTLTFTKLDGTDETQPENQDSVVSNVTLTVDSGGQFYNIAKELGTDWFSSPNDTEWAFGTIDNYLGLSYQSWCSLTGWNPPSTVVGQNLVCHIISKDIYFPMTVISWDYAGGLSYTRTCEILVTPTGGTNYDLQLNSPFIDPGATAVDVNWNLLPVITNGSVSTGTLGDYVISYTATNSGGHGQTVNRTVHVLNSSDRAVPNACMMPSYSQHSTYANAVVNEPISVWGRAWSGAQPLSYSFDFGDGSSPSNGVASDPTFIGVQHIYTAGGSKTATMTITDAWGRSVLRQTVIRVFLTPTHDTRVNMAIEKGLLWIYRNQTAADTNKSCWVHSNGGEYTEGSSAFALNAFQENGHWAYNNYEADAYAETVKKGLNWILDNGNGSIVDISSHDDGTGTVQNPDSNGNGKGVYFHSLTYANAAVFMSLILSQPNATAASNTIVTSGVFAGTNLFNLLVDACDQFGYCQGDTTSANIGAWRYDMTGPNNNYDGSAQQWAALALMAARDAWGIQPTGWVVSNAVYGYQQLEDVNGGMGYDSRGSSPNIAKTGGSLTTFKLAGKTLGDADVNKVLMYVGNNWYEGNEYWGGQPGWPGDFYQMYGAKKGLTFQGIQTVSTPYGDRDWYNDMSAWLLGNEAGSTPAGMPYVPTNMAEGFHTASYAFGQNSDGSWLSGRGFMVGGKALCTPVAVLILTKTAALPVPVPIISPVGDQLPGAAFAMDGSGSYHQDSSKSIVTYQWDWDSSNGTDWNHPDATGPRPTNPGYASNGLYTVTLRVTDNNSTPISETATLQINVTNTDIAPVAVVIPQGYPAYAGYIGDPILLDGSSSYDPNGDTITNYIWDLNGNGVYGDAGDVITTNPTVSVSFTNQYSGVIGLQVAANGKTGNSLSQIDIYVTSNDMNVVSFVAADVVTNVSADVQAVFLNNTNSAGAFSNVVVRFYNGNPYTTGSQVSSNFSVNLPRGQSVQLNAHLNGLNGVNFTNLYVYLNADRAIPEANVMNNVANMSIIPLNGQITGPTTSPSWTSTTNLLTISGLASGAVSQVTIINNRDVAGFNCSGTTNWCYNGIPLYQGENVITVVTEDNFGNAVTNTLTVTYSGDVFYDGELRSGAVIQEINFQTNLVPGETVPVTWKLLSYVPVRSCLDTGTGTSNGWLIIKNGTYLGVENSPWNIRVDPAGRKYASLYAFGCDWIVPTNIGTFKAWFNVAQMDGKQYMIATIPEGVDNWPDPSSSKLILRTISDAGSNANPQTEARLTSLPQYETLTDIMKRSGGTITSLNIPEPIILGVPTNIEWTTMAYMDINAQAYFVDMAGSNMLQSVIGTCTASSNSSYHFSSGGTNYNAKEYTFQATVTITNSITPQQIYFRHKVTGDSSSIWMSGNIAPDVDSHPYLYNGMYGRFITRTISH